jgi:hypothetical protein
MKIQKLMTHGKRKTYKENFKIHGKEVEEENQNPNIIPDTNDKGRKEYQLRDPHSSTHPPNQSLNPHKYMLRAKHFCTID